jgi:glycosyltransferase involved in cell wall biosynthesis
MRRSGNAPHGPGPHAPMDRPIIVHSHLRWDFVWQRPQQILSRLAAHTPVLFLEEPIFLDDLNDARLEITVPYANVFRAVPYVSAKLRDDSDNSIATVRALAQDAITGRGKLNNLFVNPIQWFYSPATAPSMLGAFNEVGVVYDCMDELSQFRFADPDLPRRERLLLRNADVVFTGGHKLYEAKRRYNKNVHFFGCGVDIAHFRKASLLETPIAADIANLPQPVFGYFGVIDERIDYDLIAKLAAACPEASIVMVGPVVKMDASALPQAPNIHWLGKREYSELPSYVKAFATCLMPFALNDATEYINPTKTLEYMAARKPIVSTAVADVVRNFTPVVRVARSHDQFVALTARVAKNPDLVLLAEGVKRADQASWESIITQMRRLIDTATAEATTETVEVSARSVRATELAVQ